jgi:hypothetical protein
MLICCYWYFMFKKAEETTVREDRRSKTPFTSSLMEKAAETPRPEQGKREFRLFIGLVTFHFSSMQLFFAFFVLICCGECVNFLSWLFEGINSQQLSLFSSIYFIIVLVPLFLVINNFEEKVINVLEAAGRMNSSSSKAQTKRIRALTMLANIFSISNIILELSMACYLSFQFYSKSKPS